MITKNFPIINQHATWLGINPIQGCPKRCKYCFLQSQGKTGVKPEVLISEKETITQLINSPYYNPEVALSFFTNTDSFATKDNMEYLKNLLLLCDEHQIKNVKTFITKCHIPDEFLDLFSTLIKKGHKIIVYLSYSGLDNTIERGVIHKHIRENFKRLHARKIPIIHYWRPFVPQNSNVEKLNEVLTFVSKYSSSSVVAGLKIEDKYINNLDFWPELIEKSVEVVASEGVWPKGVLDFFLNLKRDNNNYPIFQSNSCAIANVLNKPDSSAFNNTLICHFNNCPKIQRDRCDKYYRNISFDEEVFLNEMDKLGYSKEQLVYKLTANNEIIIEGFSMSVADQSYITQFLNKRVIANKEKEDLYWNTSVSGSEPLEI